MHSNVAKYPFTRLQQVLLAALLCADGGYFSLTSPQQGGSVVVILGAVMIMLTIYAGCWAVTRVLANLVEVSARTQRLLALIVTAPLIYGLLMQSIGQLNVRDLVAAIPIAGIVYFYITYGRSAARIGQSKH